MSISQYLLSHIRKLNACNDKLNVKLCLPLVRQKRMSLEAIRRQMTVCDIEGIVAKAVKAAVQVVREEFQKCFDIMKIEERL